MNGHLVLSNPLSGQSGVFLPEGSFSQSVLDALSVQIAVIDSAGNIIAVNEAWKQFAEEYNIAAPSCWGIGVNYVDFHRATADCEIGDEELLIRGIEDVVTGRQERFDQECVCHGSVRQRWFAIRVTRLVGGEPVCVVSHEDITVKKATEEAMRRDARFLEAITEGTTDSIFVKDTEGHFLMINTAGASHLGVTPTEAIGYFADRFFDRELAGAMRRDEIGVMESGETLHCVHTGVFAGTVRTLQTTLSPYRSEGGETVGVIGISRDISRQKPLRNPPILSELAVARELVTDISLEIITPLALISGFAQILQRHSDECVKQDAQTIQEMATRTAQVVSALLTLARQSDHGGPFSDPLPPLFGSSLSALKL